MKELDKDGRLLCELQGKIFESSAEMYHTSSAVFIRRYMNSGYAARMDREGAIHRPADTCEAFESLDEEYGKSAYGSMVYTSDELFWTGYIYRCWAYIYDYSSKSIYRIVNASEMHALYYAYHTMDPQAAIERIMESKGISCNTEESIEKAVRLLREIRLRVANSL